MITKICTVCGEEKDIDFFVKKSKSPDGHASECKKCHQQHGREKYYENIEVSRAKSRVHAKKSYQKTKIKRLKYAKEYRDTKLDKEAKSLYMREYRKRNRLRIKRGKKEYELTHLEKKKTWGLNYRNKNRKKINLRKLISRNSSPQNKLKHNLRNRIRSVLKGIKRGGRLHELTGCSVDFLKKHIESQFKELMNWDNYGNKGWHVDHIISIAAFDLTDKFQQHACFNWRNLQPLWGKENMSKGGKYDPTDLKNYLVMFADVYKGKDSQ